jgi:hypothetical protein
LGSKIVSESVRNALGDYVLFQSGMSRSANRTPTGLLHAGAFKEPIFRTLVFWKNCCPGGLVLRQLLSDESIPRSQNSHSRSLRVESRSLLKKRLRWEDFSTPLEITCQSSGILRSLMTRQKTLTEH